MKKSALFVLAVAPVCGLAVAEESKGPWSAEASLTYILNNGNTESETFGGKAKGIYDGEVWRTTAKLEGVNTSDEDGRTGEKYFVSAKLDRKLDSMSYIFALVEHEDDRFSGFHYQTTFTAGYGRTVIDNDVHKLSLEAGPGYRRSEIIEGDHVEEEGVLRGALDYAWKVSDTSKLTEELSVEVGDESTITKSSTKLKTKVNTSFSLTLGYDIKNQSEVPAGTKNTDTTTYITLDYTY